MHINFEILQNESTTSAQKRYSKIPLKESVLTKYHL